MQKQLVIAAACVVGLSGCTTYFKRSYLSVTGDKEKTIGSIFVWDSDVSAAVVYTNGDICAQRAMTVLQSDARVNLQVSNALMDLANAASSTATTVATATVAAVASAARDEAKQASTPAEPDGGTTSESPVSPTVTPSPATTELTRQAAEASGNLAVIAGSIDRTATLLTTTTERTAFLDIGLYYICQLGHNGALTQPEVAQMTRLLIERSSVMSTLERSETQRGGAPDGEQGNGPAQVNPPQPPIAVDAPKPL